MRLVNRYGSCLKLRDALLIAVGAHHLVPYLCKTRSRHKADVPTTDHSNPQQGHPPFWPPWILISLEIGPSSDDKLSNSLLPYNPVNTAIDRRRIPASYGHIGIPAHPQINRLPAVHANSGKSRSPGSGSSHAKIADSRGFRNERRQLRGERWPLSISFTATHKSAVICIHRSPARARSLGTGCPL